MKLRSMLLIVRETLELFGFVVYASLTMFGREDGETDVLVCKRAKGWVGEVQVEHGYGMDT